MVSWFSREVNNFMEIAILAICILCTPFFVFWFLLFLKKDFVEAKENRKGILYASWVRAGGIK